LAHQHGGKIPTRVWLRKNGYGMLENWLRTNPSYFAHLQQDRGWLKYSADHYVPIAEELAKNTGGSLPTSGTILYYINICLAFSIDLMITTTSFDGSGGSIIVRLISSSASFH